MWRFDGQTIHVLLLNENGEYLPSEHSAAFPFLPVAQLVQFLTLDATMSETKAAQAFRAWVREQMAQLAITAWWTEAMNPHQEANRRRWDELVPIHAGSAFYDVAGFQAGRSTLRFIERDELGDVRGQALLHLQCHFGLDTLSWARLGRASPASITRKRR